MGVEADLLTGILPVILSRMNAFGDVLESVESLSLDEQEDLVAIVRRRLQEHRRAELVRTVMAARKEFKAGRCQPASAEEIIPKISA